MKKVMLMVLLEVEISNELNIMQNREQIVRSEKIRGEVKSS